jgi:hypothetical protein
MEMGMEHGAWSMELAQTDMCPSARLPSSAIVCTHGNAARPTHTVDPRAGERVSE